MTDSGVGRSSDWATRIVGLDLELPLLDGRLARYINLDNAATTPPLRDVLDAVLRFLPYYSSVHRGSGVKSRVSTAAYDEAHHTIARFVGANTDTNTVIFGKNTTEAINKLSYRYPLSEDAIVLSTVMEHHSNDLPWRRRARVVRATVTSDGRLDEDDLDRLLETYRGRVALVTVSGASNVTGFVQPIHRLARKAHAAGARILVDAAQLAAHRPIDVKPDDDPEHLDFVVLSAHKMYAPFGTGALVGAKDVFRNGAPEYQGGGTVDVVTPDEVHWAGLPDREEAGSPNVVGAIAMAAAARVLMDIGDGDDAAARSVSRGVCARTIALGARNQDLRRGASVSSSATGSESSPSISTACPTRSSPRSSATKEASACAMAASARSRTWRISSESPTVSRPALHRSSLRGDRSERPGMVRISLAAYNTCEDLDALVEMLVRISEGRYHGAYRQVPESGDYVPAAATALAG